MGVSPHAGLAEWNIRFHLSMCAGCASNQRAETKPCATRLRKLQNSLPLPFITAPSAAKPIGFWVDSPIADLRAQCHFPDWSCVSCPSLVR